MKKTMIWVALCAITLTSCHREQDFQAESGRFTATLESSQTKTVLSPGTEGYDVLWRSGDQITIVDADGKAGVYATQSSTATAVFDRKSGDDAVKPSFKAYFPASIYNGGAPELPATQAYVPGNIQSAPMYAESATTKLAFKNLAGIVRLAVSSTQDGKKVRKIIFSADKPLCGPFTVSESAAVVTGDKSITLDCGEEGVEIGEEAVAFHVAVPAGTYNPFKITVITTDGEVQTRTSTVDIVVGRSQVVKITLNFGELSAVSGSAPILDGTSQPWVQLWPGGPKWARFNLGSTISTYADVTEYTHPDVVGGYYSIRGRKDSAPDGNQTEDTSYTIWGPNWATPTREQEQDLLNNCEWTFCDGETVQYQPGCTLKGWKVSGKEEGYTENDIFLPLAGARDQNTSGRAQMGTRGLYWSDGASGRYFLELFASSKNIPYHDPNHGCSVRAVCVDDQPVVEGQFTLVPAFAKAVTWQFENYPGENPKLLLNADYNQKIFVTRADGEIDLGGYTMSETLYLQNNDPERTVTVKNGTITKGIDGKDGQSDYYAGKVVVENVTVKDCIWPDGHDLTVRSGVINRIEHKKNAATPGVVTIEGGFFGEIYRYVDKYGGADDGSVFILKGGKYKVRPGQKWCADGYMVAANTDADKEDYPYAVVEGDPSADWFIGPVTDLSAKATANTYIVSEPGTYKFKATVKGNGGLDPVTGTTATPIAAADISGATVLWELSAAGRAIKYEDELYQIGYKDGYVLFNTPDTFVRGDAYIAIFKDVEGGRSGKYDKDVDEILWSWLIWATEEPGTAEYKEDTFMDRNIGAWGTNETFAGGFAYQWGRPCPFSASYNRNYAPYPYYPDRKQAFRFESIEDGKTVAYSVAHPVTFFYGGRSCWMPDDAFYNNLWSDDAKTIYDPSPIGYKVPSKDQLDGITGKLSFYGTGFIGYGSSSDFGYGNPGSVLLWSSTSDDDGGYRGAWANAYGGMTKKYGSWPDVYFASGLPVRPVREPLPTVDLSAAEAANCYLVPEEGKYKFKATVKGNGGADHSGIGKDTDPSTIAKAELIWATFNTTTAPAENELIKDIQYEDGFVFFSTGSPYKEGNALIAIKDASDNILWSWHLWFESDDMAAKAHTYPGSNAVVMDRNLGALSNCYSADNVLDFGFAYQHGRKDPFMMTASRTSYVQVGVLGTYTTAAGGSNVANSIKNPTVVFGTDGWGGDQSQWTGSDKTIFDPCPPGWHVADGGFLASQYSLFKVFENDWSTYHGLLFNEVDWYPATGDRWGSNHNNTGSTLRVWSKSGGCELASDNGGSAHSDGSNPGHGYSVRCVAE